MNKPRKPKAVTNEALARMIARGFNDVTSKMATKDDTATKDDIGNLENRLTKIEDRLILVEAKLDKALYKEIDRLETRVKRLEEKAGFI